MSAPQAENRLPTRREHTWGACPEVEPTDVSAKCLMVRGTREQNETPIPYPSTGAAVPDRRLPLMGISSRRR
jgi:hypothetical protein